MSDDGVRRELSAFLKSRRARLAPAEVGLPAGAGRRLPGLRREEVAAIAGIGLTWYTRLEQGRPIEVSTPFLENLTRALRLSEAERTHLFALAQHRAPPAAATARPSAPATAAAIKALLDTIQSPAYARNGHFDVLAWNEANTQMFGDFASIAAGDRNIIRLMFTRPYYRRTMPNWEADARALLAKFRLNYGQAVDKAAYLGIVQDLLARSSDFRRMWADHEVADAGEGVYLYRTARYGTIAFQHYTVTPELAPNLRIVVYVRGS